MNVSGLRELYAVCQRATRTWEGGDVEGLVVGMIAGIPFVLPSSFGPSVERREGEDLVVSTPLPVCDDCWKQLDGGAMFRLLSTCSQVAFAVGVVTLIIFLYTKMRGAGISLLWPLGAFACALPPYFLADRIRAGWAARITQYMRAVPQYDKLLNTFPDAEIFTRRPTALMDDEAIGQTQAKDT